MIRLDPAVYAARFDRLFEIEREIPSGSLETCMAPKVNGGGWFSKGSEKSRLCLDDLKGEKYKIAATLDSPRYGYESVFINIDKVQREVFINVRSALKRLGNADDLVRYNKGELKFGEIGLDDSFDYYFRFLVRLAREKELLGEPESDESQEIENDLEKPLLQIGHRFDPQKSIDKIVQVAKLQNFSVRLSTRHFPVLKCDTEVHPDGFVAFATGEKAIPEVAGLEESFSVTPDKKRVRRISTWISKHSRASVLRIIKIYNDLQGVGVFTPLSIGFCLDTSRNALPREFVRYYNCYNYHLADVHDFLPKENSLLEIAHQLLQGLDRIAKFGFLGNLDKNRIRVWKKLTSFEAIIVDLRRFTYHEDSEKKANKGSCERDVLDLGRIFSTELFISNQFPPALRTLLDGMQDPHPKKRWTAAQCLKFFNENFMKEEETKDDS